VLFGRGVAVQTKSITTHGFGAASRCRLVIWNFSSFIIRKTGKGGFFMSKAKNSELFKIVLTAMLIALNVVMERFMSFNVWNHSIGFSFITIAFAAVFLGIPYAVAVGAFGDIIGAILFPFGSYFVGFTITNILSAFITAIFIYKKVSIVNVGVCVILNKIITTLLINSWWITILYKDSLDAFPLVFVGRIPQAVIMAVVEIVIVTLLFNDKSKIRTSINKFMGKLI
jgi:ECF transporter S component (folate family)